MNLERLVLDFFNDREFGDLDQIYDYVVRRLSGEQSRDCFFVPERFTLKMHLLNSQKIIYKQDSQIYTLKKIKMPRNKQKEDDLRHYFNCGIEMLVKVGFSDDSSLLQYTDRLRQLMKPQKYCKKPNVIHFHFCDTEKRTEVIFMPNAFSIRSDFIENEDFVDLIQYVSNQPLENEPLYGTFLIFPQIYNLMALFREIKNIVSVLNNDKILFQINELKILERGVNYENEKTKA